LQRSPNFRKRSWQVRKKEETEPADDDIKCFVIHGEILGIHNSCVEVLYSLFARGLGCQGHEFRRYVGREHKAGWADTRRRQQRLVTIASRDVENPSAGANMGKIKHQFRRMPYPRPYHRNPAMPSFGSALPLLSHRLPVSHGIDALPLLSHGLLVLHWIEAPWLLCHRLLLQVPSLIRRPS